jgi:hypothetical protein
VSLVRFSCRSIATIIAVVFFTSIGFAQNGAKIEFKAENNTIDYGTKGKDNGIRVFEFTNTGTNSPLSMPIDREF